MVCRITLFAVALALVGCGVAPPVEPPPPAPVVTDDVSEPPPPAAADPEPPAADEAELRVTDSGLGIVDLTEGEGEEAVVGAKIAVHYVGKLEDGRVFDSSRERDRPFRFVVGDEMVIAGWNEGVVGMKIGGVRRLVVPPHLAYGERGHGVIPGGAILEFEIELLEVERRPEP